MRAPTRAERVVRAPTVGRFVVDHPTTREPFMARGTPARRGDVIAMIECGGFLRAVVAEVEGVVRDVLADDGTLVEFGQPLFAIEVSE
jgi:biotin carboxyl carrier protein